MALIKCSDCGSGLVSDLALVCPNCGNPLRPARVAAPQSGAVVTGAKIHEALDCPACKTPQSMKAKNGWQGGILNATGFLVLLSSVGGILFAIALPAIGSLFYGRIILVDLGFLVGIISLIVGVAAWSLLSRRNVYKCEHCGFTERT